MPITSLQRDKMKKLTLLNYRIWNIYLLLLVSLLLLGCSYAGKPTFKTCQDVCDGLVGYYPFIGNANDLSGNGNDGNVSGATLTNDRDENVDSAYLFNGKDSFIEFPDLIKKDSYTLVAIVKVLSTPEITDKCSKSAIISQYQNGGLLYTKCSGPYGKHQFWYQMHKPHWSPLAERLPKKGDALNTYYHVAVTADKKTNTLSLYRNGGLISRKKHENIERLKELLIGIQEKVELTKRKALHGIIDEVRVYDRALSSEEIYKIFEE